MPFCLMNSTAGCRGIGEKITVFPSGGPLHLLLVMGGAGVSTAALFRSLKMDKLLHPDTDSAEAALRTGRPLRSGPPPEKRPAPSCGRKRPPNPGDSGAAAEGRRTGRQHDGLRSMLFRAVPHGGRGCAGSPRIFRSAVFCCLQVIIVHFSKNIIKFRFLPIFYTNLHLLHDNSCNFW